MIAALLVVVAAFFFNAGLAVGALLCATSTNGQSVYSKGEQ
jgi:hypothetical protein